MAGSDASSDLARIIGANIKAARKAKGLRQRQLSERLDIDVMAVSNWERGVYQPSMGNLVAAAELLGQPLAWFFTEREPNGEGVAA